MVVKARQGIPHLMSVVTPKGNKAPTVSEEEFNALFTDGKMLIDRITEKTDGQAWIIGYDELGFFTKHSGSGDEKARQGTDHIRRAVNRAEKTGKPYNHMVHEAFSAFHNELHNNRELIRLLDDMYDGVDVNIKGEAFIRQLATANKDTITFNKIPYLSIAIGAVGTFVVHSQLSENKRLDFVKLVYCSDVNIRFNTDCLSIKPFYVHLDPTLSSYEEQKVMVASQILKHLWEGSMWGDHREGIVVHTNTIKFKIIDPDFNQYKGNW